MNHHIIVRNREITVVNPVMVQSNVAVDTVTVSVDSEYDGLQVALVIGGTQLMYDGEPVTVPSSELERAGDLPLTVLGLSAGKRVVTASAESAFRVLASGAFEGEKPVPDAPDMLQQLADAYAAANRAAGAATDAAGSAAGAARAALDSAVLADAAAEGADNAAKDARDAASSAASVADKYIESARATTLEPGSQATASVENHVLTIGVPEGEKGDKGDPGHTPQRGVDYWTAEDVEAIVEDAKTQAVAELAEVGNVPKRTVTDLVAHGEDAYAQKPIEVRVKGKTWVNRWPVIEGTHNGITVATDETGLVTVTGTATADADVTADVSGWAAGKSYTTMVSATPTGCSAYFKVQKPSGNTSINATTTGATLNVASDAINCVAGVHVTGGTAINASFRVMLVDGTEAPDCFTPPASIASVEAGNLVTSGKNLVSLPDKSGAYRGVSFSVSDNVITVDCDDYDIQIQVGISSVELLPGDYTFSVFTSDSDGVVFSLMDPNDGYKRYGGNIVGAGHTTFSISKPTTLNVSPGRSVAYQAGHFVGTVQIELGSTATSYEPPTVTETPLPEVELRSLPNGTCDELVIRADGTCEVERRIGIETFDGSEIWSKQVDSASSSYAYTHSTPRKGIPPRTIQSNLLSDVLPNETCYTGNSYLNVQSNMTLEEFQEYMSGKAFKIYYLQDTDTEPQSPVTLPALPAPTFNAYSDADIPSDTSVEYARDINIVLSNLEAVQAALLGGE